MLEMVKKERRVAKEEENIQTRNEGQQKRKRNIASFHQAF